LLGLGGQIDMSVAIALGAMSAIAVFAGVFMADVLQDYEVRWKVLQLLVFLLADALALLAAAGASLFRFIQVVFDGQAWQMVGKFLTTVLGTVGRFGSGSGRWRQKFNPGHQQAEQ
jgi:ABC-type spermidine/putrescine transport system permease subunit II